jgi:addiction module HigA family antidote
MSSISALNNTIEAPLVPGVPPVHPGAVLAEILVNHGLSVIDAAARLGLSRQTLHRLLAGQRRVSAEMALRLGRLVRERPGHLAEPPGAVRVGTGSGAFRCAGRGRQAAGLVCQALDRGHPALEESGGGELVGGPDSSRPSRVTRTPREIRATFCAPVNRLIPLCAPAIAPAPRPGRLGRRPVSASPPQA